MFKCFKDYQIINNNKYKRLWMMIMCRNVKVKMQSTEMSKIMMGSHKTITQLLINVKLKLT